MGRKKKAPPPGAPEWMVTFGDMMSLLLCFFVIIVSMSEVKKDERFQKVMESIKRSFGYRDSIGFGPGENVPTNTLDPEKINLIIQQVELNKGRSKDRGIIGDSPTVRNIREGMEYIIGGKVSFEEGKAELLETAKWQIDVFAEGFVGLNSRIRVRGHAARKSPDRYRPYKTLDELSFARAMAIKKYLMKSGIREDRITVEACGDNEPVASQAYDETERAKNRRVSIIVTENLVEEYQGAPPADIGDSLDG
jgi:chemotaxis protein MotB